MIKIENVVTPSGDQWNSIIMGMRNPMNSWAKSDSLEVAVDDEGTEYIYSIGPNDHKLLMNLRNAGPSDRKVLRMIPVYLDITAPLYWWKEFDTYKVGTVANSCSTMHKIHAKEFVLEDFSWEHLMGLVVASDKEYKRSVSGAVTTNTINMLYEIISCLNTARAAYLETKDKKYWWQMIQLLPSSYNQKRTIFLNYEVLLNMYHSRKNHKLDEWRTLCKWIEELPYSEIITGRETEDLASKSAGKEPEVTDE